MIGTSFLRVAAHDDDFGTNAAISYSMSLEEPEYLRVQPLTGWVYVNQPISQVGRRDNPLCAVWLRVWASRVTDCYVGWSHVNQPVSQVRHSGGPDATMGCVVYVTYVYIVCCVL